MQRMLRICVLLSLVVFALFPVSAAVDITLLVPGTQIVTNASTGVANPILLSKDASGRLLLVNASTDATGEELFRIDVSGPTPVFAKITDSAALIAAVDAANGGSAAPATANFQGVAVDSNGNIIILTDQAAPETGFLFRVSPNSPYTVEVISGLDGTPSAIEGNSALAVYGTTAYIYTVGSFGGPNGNALLQISTTAPAGGTTAATVFVSQATFDAVTGGTTAIRGIVPESASNLVAINSASSGANDDVLDISVPGGVVTVRVAATSIETDLGVTDIGQNGVTIDSAGNLFMLNGYGATTSDDGIIIKPASGTAAMFATETEITDDPDIVNSTGGDVTSLYLVNNTIDTLGVKDVVFADGNADGVIRLRDTTGVDTWTLY